MRISKYENAQIIICSFLYRYICYDLGRLVFLSRLPRRISWSCGLPLSCCPTCETEFLSPGLSFPSNFFKGSSHDDGNQVFFGSVSSTCLLAISSKPEECRSHCKPFSFDHHTYKKNCLPVTNLHSLSAGLQPLLWNQKWS